MPDQIVVFGDRSRVSIEQPSDVTPHRFAGEFVRSLSVSVHRPATLDG